MKDLRSSETESVKVLESSSRLFLRGIGKENLFITMAIPEGEDARLRSCSNMSRATSIKLVKEWLFRQDEYEKWMNRIR